MRLFILALGLLGALLVAPSAGFGGEAVAAAPAVSAAEVAPDLQTGTLLFSEGDCLAIRVYTASRYTHVAVVCIEEDEPIVYDSMNGIGVRRQTLAEYFACESPHEIHVLHPRQPLTAEQGSQLQSYLHSQLGRPYAIGHHLTGKRNEGLHCSEYATDALMSIGLITAERPPKVSPASLAEGITRADIYTTGATIALEPPEPPQEPASNRCHQLWLDTKQCTRKCCDKLSGWFLCR